MSCFTENFLAQNLAPRSVRLLLGVFNPQVPNFTGLRRGLRLVFLLGRVRLLEERCCSRENAPAEFTSAVAPDHFGLRNQRKSLGSGYTSFIRSSECHF